MYISSGDSLCRMETGSRAIRYQTVEIIKGKDSMMIRKDAILGTRLPALFQDTDLFRNFPKSPNDFLVAIHECENGIRDTCVATKLEDKLLRATQVVTRDTGVEVVDCLELKTTVEEIKPRRTVHVHGGTEHLLREGLVDTQVRGGHGEV